MKLEKIITLANKTVEIPFRAMERSLRAVGCNLPLYVIPYDDRLFDLPENAQWWLGDAFADWLKHAGGLPVMRKYQCLLSSNYQFVDSDVIFLKNPEDILAPYEGFVTSCCHWHNPDETLTEDSKKYFSERTTVWQHQVFNTGQFACSDQLYTLHTLQQKAGLPRFRPTCLNHKYHEQPGLNMLVIASGVRIQNLTQPPVHMESTWAGDYPGRYDTFWENDARMPYLIHWAGAKMQRGVPISELFYDYLSDEEAAQFDAKQSANKQKRPSLFRRLGRAVKAGWRALKTS